jgi:hypothetical protein
VAASQNFTYLTIEVNDNKASDILTCIPATNIFIESALDNEGGVLVHWCVVVVLCLGHFFKSLVFVLCGHSYGGRSRSPAVIIAYLMSTAGYTFDKALTLVQGARSVVALNSGDTCRLCR